MSDLNEGFKHAGFAVIRGVMAETELDLLFASLRRTLGSEPSDGDSGVPGTPYAYKHPAGQWLLQSLLPMMEEVAGTVLGPTYSYMRLYKHGDVLPRHTDRPACEISGTLCLGYAPDAPWPIWLERDGCRREITLYRGDMLVYRGIDTPHWREAYEGETLAQVFLHYVDMNGPHGEWLFDKQPAPLPMAIDRNNGAAGSTAD